MNVVWPSEMKFNQTNCLNWDSNVRPRRRNSTVNPSPAIMVFFNLSALLALTMAALAVAGPVGTVDAANKKWHCDEGVEGVEGVDAVNCNWSRNVDVDVANKKWHCDEGVEGVDAVNCNWSRNVDVANKKWHCDESAEGVDVVNCSWT
ncbi:hypothetical protein MVEN_01287400 [Mycena venus]|uniref:Uncharacterized protein n=1 Tax=Mycena venus TaxID=2733690 RepID=A0A8H7CTJ9_9AGAR|nr:hypothetical protein MVEN_01287400 [Mycena venus]